MMKSTHDSPILVTGAAGAIGAIGRNLTAMLLAKGHKVRALVRREDERADALRRLGAGTGRDAAGLAVLGYSIVAVEPTEELRRGAMLLHPSPMIEWLDDSLPDLSVVRAGCMLRRRSASLTCSHCGCNLIRGDHRPASPGSSRLSRAGGRKSSGRKWCLITTGYTRLSRRRERGPSCLRGLLFARR